MDRNHHREIIGINALLAIGRANLIGLARNAMSLPLRQLT